MRGGFLDQVSGSQSTREWDDMMSKMKPLASIEDDVLAAALRADAGVEMTTSQFPPNFASLDPLENLKLTKPFSFILGTTQVLKKHFQGIG